MKYSYSIELCKGELTSGVVVGRKDYFVLRRRTEAELLVERHNASISNGNC